MAQATYFHLYDADKDPREILNPANQWSTPWGNPSHGPCDKCGGAGRTQYTCLSCVEDATIGQCAACQGRIEFTDTCPACEGSGVIDRTTRRGVSAFPSRHGLYRYLAARDVDLSNCVLLELTANLGDERDLDADSGAVLVLPTEVLARHPVDHAYIATLRPGAEPRVTKSAPGNPGSK
jgi:hypothetical protein